MEFFPKEFMRVGWMKSRRASAASKARIEGPQLFAKLEELIGELKKSSLIVALVVNGSFVTGKAAPIDVDVLTALGTGHDWQADLTLGDYALARTAACVGVLDSTFWLRKMIRNCIGSMCAFTVSHASCRTPPKAF